MRLRPPSDFPTPAFRLVVPVILAVVLPVWSVSYGLEKGWLYLAGVVGAAAAGAPLVARTRSVVGFACATVALVFASWFIGFLIWAPFVHWE